MRFLGIGDSCDLGALYLDLVRTGHDVRVDVRDPMCHGTLAGLVDRTDDWRRDLPWIREAGPEGVILFENVAGQRGALQDALRREGLNVIGGSAFGDRLENDRAYAQGLLSEIGLPICATHAFEDVDAARAFLRAQPGRYVLKFNGPAFASSDNYVGRRPDGADVAAMLERHRRRLAEGGGSFILMAHVEGVEMGTGAYFNGERFIEPACLDWEHKRFFPGDLGELTGEMGTVVTYRHSGRFFARTLKRMAPWLREHGHVGYVNLNTIVNEHGIWPLEFTCRFGYPGFAILAPLQRTGWAALFRRMVARDGDLGVHPGFAAGVVLTVPPFPYTRRQVNEAVGAPVFIEGLGPDDRAHVHYGEVGLAEGQLVTSGIYGWTMVVTGRGATIVAAREAAMARADRVFTPNLRYRRDIGDRLIAGDLRRVQDWGLLADD